MSKDITFEEFLKTVYYTEKKIVLPLIDVRLDKVDYFTKGKLDSQKVNSAIMTIYEKKFNK